MPRNPALKHKTAHPRDTGSYVPYLRSFTDLLENSDTPTRTSDLVSSYISYIRTRTETRSFELQAKSGFNRAFRKTADFRGIRHCTSPRGYYVKLPKLLRNAKHTFEREAGKSAVFERIFIDKNKGYGVFAMCDIPKEEILIEYKGQWIDQAEYYSREINYGNQNLPPVAVFDKNRYLDANRNTDGILFSSDENIARYFNHSKTSPNCKLIGKIDIFGVKKLYLQTKFAIPNGMELLWDYYETNRDVIQNNPWLVK